MGKLVLLSMAVLGVAFLALGVGIFFGKKKKFPEGSISKNTELKNRGITCASHDERQRYNCGLGGGCCGGANHLDEK